MTRRRASLDAQALEIWIENYLYILPIQSQAQSPRPSPPENHLRLFALAPIATMPQMSSTPMLTSFPEPSKTPPPPSGSGEGKPGKMTTLLSSLFRKRSKEHTYDRVDDAQGSEQNIQKPAVGDT
ncbi:hypothetical protein BV25DRAFT_1827977 [Artomyces pyxidatus]|uniref:Uncharacterized protein n=1 Tax=Artomyces pyxidatus TaxID=48021 RepID=A0ACB8SVR1_9AGAM|nr:hypothetical protein BV25DRAFT_1827977 [Artomyces pyxidatus]